MRVSVAGRDANTIVTGMLALWLGFGFWWIYFDPLRLALSAGAAAAMLVEWLRPAPWLLALLLVAILSAVWCFAVSRFLRADAWASHDRPAPGAYVAGVEEAAVTDPARPQRLDPANSQH